MGSIIRVNFFARWSRPVYVGLGDHLDTTITGPADAIRYVGSKFQSQRGTNYFRAHAICHHALLGEVCPDVARQPSLDAWVDQNFHLASE
ncbi:DUF982 domain-containing protein [Agrobacterium sp. Ap1]|uniref:DUF982 domain-containing protein n=1 Tax=Agrobacterium sp. Ap1 TaxID=2815337 RepID=UPI001A8F9B3C|nr:DUF982 domain-containing protein [Agrobacterium sp. Ap1]